MRTQDLTSDDIRALDATAVLVYQSKSGGVYGVCELAKLLQWEEYNRCEPCDEMLPVLDGCCMVCGTMLATTEEDEMDEDKKMYEHEETHCLYCDKPLPAKGLEKNYCNTDCAWNDGERWERDRRDDMSRYYEV